MFEHSVKVPRHYKIAANIFKKVSTEGGSVKTLLYDNKLRHFRTNVLYALITETIKHAVLIDNIFEHCNLLQNESRLDPWLAKVLTAELLFGKKTLPGKSKPEQTIQSYKDKFESFTSDQDYLKTEAVRRPRYVRINTSLLTTSDAIRAFQDEGYRFVRCTSSSYEDYLQQIQNLQEYDFVQDFHVKYMFVFPSGTKLHEHELYLENKIILQDKATAMAVHLLAPPQGSVVLDMCAAPGMKTTQLAAYMRNNGKIYAVERNEKRYQTLCDFVSRTGSVCVQIIHKDALEIKRGDYDDVEYVILDPSCSGSGMDLCVHSYIEADRLAKLTSLQEKFLKHAMNAFPKAKRIVYSTCSLFPEENERVITNVVKTSRAKWRVQDVKELLKGHWKNFGSGMYGSMGTRCMYAKPDSDLTTGFFLAVLDRDQKDLEKAIHTEDIGSQEKNENKEKIKIEGDEKSHNKKSKNQNVEENLNELSVEEAPKKKKQKLVSENKDNEDSNNINENYDVNDAVEVETKKKKRKHQIVNSLTNNFEELTVNNNNVSDAEAPKKKKKKKDKHKENGDSNIDTAFMIQETDDNVEVSNNKKKKKRKQETQSMEETNVLELPEKENKNRDLNVEPELQDDIGEVPKKKKKKKHVEHTME